MSLRRLSTVHDLAALRLHPDGTRVQNSESNRTQRRAKYATRDARGNWFARDAGGLGTVKQRRTVRSDDGRDDQEGEVFDLTGVDGGEDDVPSTSKGKERAQDEPEERLKDPRAKKRRRFHEDWSFLENDISTQATEANVSSGEGSPVGSDTFELPKPSSDLLKCLHYFATTYYDATGQLYDASREARRLRKLRRLKKLRERSGSAEDDSPQRGQSSKTSLDGEEHESSTEEEDDVDDDIEDKDEDEDEDMEEEESKDRVPSSSRAGSRSQRRKQVHRDMYKIFDGSALVAIGMFVQEHIKQMLTADMPESWEKEMAAAEETGASTDKKRGRSRRRKRPRKGKKGLFGSDEEAEGAQTTDEDTEDRSDDHSAQGDHDVRRSSRRKTRGVIQPLSSAPFEDDDSNDEDYHPS